LIGARHCFDQETDVKERKLIFITGASRSGTTLLSFMLRNHPAVHGLKECQYFGQWWDPRDSGRRFTRAEAIEAAAAMFACQEHGVLAHRVGAAHRLRAAAVIDSLGAAGADPAVLFAAVAQELATAAGKTIPCEQTPRNIFYARRLLDIYPAAHIVHIVRDPRAVMASQKLRWQRRSLAENGKAVPRYESLRVWVNYHPYTVARLWSRASSVALQMAERPRVTLIRFEDLLREPEATVRLLCTRLGLEYDPAMLDVPQVNSSHQSSAGGARRGLHTDAIDQWRSKLSETETAITERYCGRLMRRFGYDIGKSRSATNTAGEIRYRLSYIAHLGGVLLVNPRRAVVQGRALLRASMQHPAIVRGEHTD
jgi:omega-hydroxy-beta-dihydromenaquinone-9 sulfotransferase